MIEKTRGLRSEHWDAPTFGGQEDEQKKQRGLWPVKSSRQQNRRKTKKVVSQKASEEFQERNNHQCIKRCKLGEDKGLTDAFDNMAVTGGLKNSLWRTVDENLDGVDSEKAGG